MQEIKIKNDAYGLSEHTLQQKHKREFNVVAFEIELLPKFL